MTAPAPTPYFLNLAPHPAAPLQLFCLPHAGAGAAAYLHWPGPAGPDIDLFAYNPPGRERRLAEPPGVEPARLAAAVAARADRPYALFGHSLGGRVAFEVLRELRRTGGPMPVRLLVSGCTPPDTGRVGGPFEGLSELDDAGLLAGVATRGNVPAAVLAEPGLMELLLPAFRADFAWLDRYVYRAEEPLAVPVSAFAGAGDPSATPERMARWREHTTGEFTLHTYPGGHFFHQERSAEVLRQLRADLFGETAAASGAAL